MHTLTLSSILLLILFPPIGALLWWLMSRGWAISIQGTDISERTKKRQRRTLFILLIIAYLCEVVGLFMRR
jgi:hypothetical protein